MKKKIFLFGTILIVIVLLIMGRRLSLARARMQAEVRTFKLEKTDLVDSVYVSGTVISSNSKNVYSKVANYPIKEVLVEVGDKVKAGDVLARIDTTSLELDIKQTELNIKNAEEGLKNEKASIQYNLQKATNSLELATIDLEDAQKNFDEIKIRYEASAISEDEFSRAKTVLEKAQISYDNALITLEEIKSKSTALTENNIEIQKSALEKQKKILNDAKILSPIDGTITMVNAKENGTASGLLFIVEDTENLVVSTTIGEYDISLVKTGQEVIVRADGIGDKELKGTVSEIAPTAIKDVSGNTASTTNVQFDTKITLDEKDPNLKIGMNVRLTIILNEKKEVYSVPYDAVVTEADGSQYIYVLETDKSESKARRRQRNTSRKIQVQTGLETDMYVEISSPDLIEGMEVIIDPAHVNIPGIGG